MSTSPDADRCPSNGREIPDEKSLDDPNGRLRVVETVLPQRCRPVLTQIDAQAMVPFGRCPAQARQDAPLPLDDLGLIDFVDGRRRRPVQSVSPTIQSRGQNHRLADAGLARVAGKVIEGSRPHAEVVRHPVDCEVREIDCAVDNSGEQFQSDRPDQHCGERVADHRIGLPTGDRSRRSDQCGGRAHSRLEVPTIVMSPWHCRPLESRCA